MRDTSRFSVRSLKPSDIPNIVAYWANASAEDLERMGVDPAKLPPPEKTARDLELLHATPDAEKRTAYLIWHVDGLAIGFSSLKKIVHGESGEMHLHMWKTAFRSQGFGPVLFALSAVVFYRRFKLKRIKCEPRSSNPAPNSLMRKIGFPLVRTHTAASSELSVVCELNEYDIQLEIVERYLSINTAR